MKPPKPHRRTVKIIGINWKIFIDLSILFKDHLDMEESRIGEYVLTHWRIQDTNPIDLIVCTSDKIRVSGSPLIPKSEFDQMATRAGC